MSSRHNCTRLVKYKKLEIGYVVTSDKDLLAEVLVAADVKG
jgi:hypothetical protein